jgi:mono/diheme cytochrome c family protein
VISRTGRQPGIRLVLTLLALLYLALSWGKGGQPDFAMAQEEKKPEEKKIAIASSNPLSGDPEAIKQGAKIYFTYCVQCHGQYADGRSRFGEYAYDLRKFWRGYAEFIAIVTKGRPQKGMPPWGKYLDGWQIARIGAFLETLAIEGANWK